MNTRTCRECGILQGIVREPTEGESPQSGERIHGDATETEGGAADDEELMQKGEVGGEEGRVWLLRDEGR